MTCPISQHKGKWLDAPLFGRDSRHVKMTAVWKLMAISLGLLLVSCGATRASLPTRTSAQELSRSVLILEKTRYGQVTHSWEPLSSFDLSQLPYRVSDGSVEGSIVRAAWTRSSRRSWEAQAPLWSSCQPS